MLTVTNMATMQNFEFAPDNSSANSYWWQLCT